MKNNIYKLFIVGFAFFFTSCDSYLDVNDSPNNPQYEDLSPVLTLSAAETQTFRLVTGDTRNFESSIRNSSMNQLGNLMMNSWAGNVNNTTQPYDEEYRSQLTAAFYRQIWDWGYTNIANFQKIIDYKSDNYDNHKAIAMILKSFYMQSIVDLYGDCPYSEAFSGSKVLYPKYDDDKTIYRALFAELNTAITLIDNANGQDTAVGTEDAMLSGAMSKWKEFANTIKLRLLIRESSSTNPASIAFVAAELSTLSTANFLTTNVTINPGYNTSTGDRQNPFYAAYGYSNTGVASTNRNLVTATKFAADALNGTLDPRRGRLFTLVSGSVSGIQQGALSGTPTAPSNPSLLGPAIIPVPVAGNATIGSSMNGYVMTLSEVEFLLAEAALLNPAYGSPKNHFDNGITASFTRLGAGGVAGYLISIDSVAGFGWTATTNKIEAIMTQKWIALMSVNAQESWIDYVRTGFPVVPMALTNTVGKPKRLMYPTSEYVANSENVPVQTATTPFMSGPFWLN